MSFSRWILNILIALDQLLNAIFRGRPNETISSRLGRKLIKGTATPFDSWICKELDKIDPDHCTKEANSGGN